jgi:hypothetical protein
VPGDDDIHRHLVGAHNAEVQPHMGWTGQQQVGWHSLYVCLRVAASCVCRLWLLPPPGQVAGAAAGAAGSGPGGPLLRRVVVQWGRVARPESKDRRAEWAVKFKEVLDRDEVC